MKKLFGTDGVRGVVNRELLPETALKLGRAGAYVLTQELLHAPKIILGKDTRRSGDMLEAALTAGLCSLGAYVYHAGVIPTPAVAHLVRKYGFDAGVMITASHNPMEDNGIKFFNADGCKLPDATEDEIERLYYGGETEIPRPEGEAIGIRREANDAERDYIDYLISTAPGLSLEGMKIALDCANGAVSWFAPELFKRLNAEACVINAEPDGANINAGCGSTHIGALKDFMRVTRCEIGFAFDGDGDRVLCVDDTNEVVEGDVILAICGADLHETGKSGAVVTTAMSNIGLKKMCRERGIDFYETAVGDRYVIEKMLEGGHALGGEESGHIIFLEHNTTGDGLLTCLQLLSIVKRNGKTLSRLKSVMEKLPMILVNANVPNERKREWRANPKIKSCFDEIESALNDDGRIFVRPSGTEPLVRVMIEGPDESKIKEWANELAVLIESELS